MQQAVEGQIGMLTCQLLEAKVQLQLAHMEIARLNGVVQAQADGHYEEMSDEEVLRDEAKFEHEA